MYTIYQKCKGFRRLFINKNKTTYTSALHLSFPITFSWPQKHAWISESPVKELIILHASKCFWEKGLSADFLTILQAAKTLFWRIPSELKQNWKKKQILVREKAWRVETYDKLFVKEQCFRERELKPD